MKNILKILVAVFVLSCTATACGEKGGGVEPASPLQIATVQFVSALKDAPIGTSAADYDKITNYFASTLDKRTKCCLAFVDRTDTDYAASSEMFAGALNTALRSRHFTCYALNRIVNTTKFQGTTVMLNRYMTDVYSHRLSDNAHITGTTALLNFAQEGNPSNTSKAAVNFWTVRITDSRDCSALADAFAQMKRQTAKYVVVGTVAGSVSAELKQAVEGSAAGKFSYMVHPDSQGSDYVLFAAFEKADWTVESDSSLDLGGGVKSYSLSVKK